MTPVRHIFDTAFRLGRKVGLVQGMLLGAFIALVSFFLGWWLQ
jgi:hypothetical protein